LLSHKRIHSNQLDEKERIERIRKDEIKRHIESALFTARRILSLNEICKIFHKNRKEDILKLIRELSVDYKNFSSVFEIIELFDFKFHFKVKDHTLNSIAGFTQGNLLSKSEIKTLAVISYLQPSATVKNLFSKRGRSKTVYNNIERLKKLKFVAEKDGLLVLTQNFFDYFNIKDISSEKMKKLIKNQF